MPWPEEEVKVQQGCSRLEELGLFPCSRPTAKVRALIFGLLLPLLQAMAQTDRHNLRSLALALTSLLMAKLILVLWVVQSASTSGGAARAA